MTPEPSEHYISMMIYLCREFTVNNLIYIIQNLIRFEFDVSNGDLKVARSTQFKGHVVTIHHQNMKNSVELHRVSIRGETDPDVTKAEKILTMRPH